MKRSWAALAALAVTGTAFAQAPGDSRGAGTRTTSSP